MAISFPVTGVITTAITVATRSPAFSLGTLPQVNDILVAFISATAVSVLTTPSDWNNVLAGNTDVDSDTHSACMLWHRYTQAEYDANTMSWTLTNTWGATTTGRISVITARGCSIGGQLNVGFASGLSTANSATPWVIPSVTPGEACAIVAGMSGDGTSTQTTPANWTYQVGAGTTQSNYIFTRDAAGVKGSATGTTNVTPSGGDEYASIVLCLLSQENVAPNDVVRCTLPSLHRAAVR